MNTCRLCKKTNYESYEELLRYGKGSRSNAHASCILKRWGPNGFFVKVSRHQYGRVPAMLAQEYGILDRLISGRL